MARAAVRAKQAQRAQAQAAAAPSRKQRKHASGGNPNQDLFFSRLRRRQKWVFIGLAVVFAISFAALGVGSGSGAGLDQIFKGILGNGDDPVAKAQAEIKTNPAKGYQDLASAYVTKSDLTNAISAMQSYVAIKKKDSRGWAQLGGYEKTQADTAAAQYQQGQQATQLEAPGSVFQLTGPLSTLATNPIDQYYAQQNAAVSGPLYQKAIAGYQASVTDFENAAQYAPRASRADAELTVYSAAQAAGDTKAELQALQRYVALKPHASNLKQIEGLCKQLNGSCVPKSSKHKK